MSGRGDRLVGSTDLLYGELLPSARRMIPLSVFSDRFGLVDECTMTDRIELRLKAASASRTSSSTP